MHLRQKSLWFCIAVNMFFSTNIYRIQNGIGSVTHYTFSLNCFYCLHLKTHQFLGILIFWMKNAQTTQYILSLKKTESVCSATFYSTMILYSVKKKTVVFLLMSTSGVISLSLEEIHPSYWKWYSHLHIAQFIFALVGSVTHVVYITNKLSTGIGAGIAWQEMARNDGETKGVFL